jgi:hypothetical protein
VNLLHHREHFVPFEEPTDEVSWLWGERHRLRGEADRLRVGAARMEREMDRLRTENDHLRRQVTRRRWWQR